MDSGASRGAWTRWALRYALASPATAWPRSLSGPFVMAMFETLARVMTDPRATLKIKCGACLHDAVWTRLEAFARLGSDSAPYDIRRKLICGKCGGRSQISVWV